MTHQIVTATEALIAEVEVWLDEEEAAYEKAKAEWERTYEGEPPVRGFRCNWDSVKEHWGKGNSKVDMLLVDGKAVGFLSDTDIVEIHPDYRGRSLGVFLSDFMLKRIYDANYSILEIEIAPLTAQPFWLRQGFEVLDNDIHFHHGTHAYMKISRSFELGAGPRVPVEIEFYDERERYGDGKPFLTWSDHGERLPDGSIQLSERVHGYSPLIRYNTENHIRIVVDGKELYFGRSKYGKQHGTERDPRGNHYIDRIVP